MADCSAQVLNQNVVVYILSTTLAVDTFYHDDCVSSLKSYVPNSRMLSSSSHLCTYGMQRYRAAIFYNVKSYGH